MLLQASLPAQLQRLIDAELARQGAQYVAGLKLSTWSAAELAADGLLHGVDVCVARRVLGDAGAELAELGLLNGYVVAPEEGAAMPNGEGSEDFSDQMLDFVMLHPMLGFLLGQ